MPQDAGFLHLGHVFVRKDLIMRVEVVSDARYRVWFSRNVFSSGFECESVELNTKQHNEDVEALMQFLRLPGLEQLRF